MNAWARLRKKKQYVWLQCIEVYHFDIVSLNWNSLVVFKCVCKYIFRKQEIYEGKKIMNNNLWQANYCLFDFNKVTVHVLAVVMSLQWTAVATFLYTELFLCVALMLPGITAQRYVLARMLELPVAGTASMSILCSLLDGLCCNE